MSAVAVLHLIDSLEAGGAERMAVNIANLLPRDRFQSHLCVTRRGGLLERAVAAHVAMLRLGRRRTLDFSALMRLRAYIKQHGIRILHAHGSSLFSAVLGQLGRGGCALVWHDHFGGDPAARPVAPYRLLSKFADRLLVVSPHLGQWAQQRLRYDQNRIVYLPNFVADRRGDTSGENLHLPGRAGKRIVCVANFRPQKNHPLLVRAMAEVVSRDEGAHLLLVGATVDARQLALVEAEIRRLRLGAHISILGQRDDVPAILARCDVGVLSSDSEGLPLSLVEYGAAGLAAVATRVGQCPAVLDQGRVGLLVRPGDERGLAETLLQLLNSPEDCRRLGWRFREWVNQSYGPAPSIARISEVYAALLAGSS